EMSVPDNVNLEVEPGKTNTVTVDGFDFKTNDDSSKVQVGIVGVTIPSWLTLTIDTNDIEGMENSVDLNQLLEFKDLVTFSEEKEHTNESLDFIVQDVNWDTSPKTVELTLEYKWVSTST
ncbi:MAG: hypothetical protein ACOC88_02710, partial [Candidatus Bipolaricaulota bacterium]